MLPAPLDPVRFAETAGQLASNLSLLASAPRLMILCRLSEAGEMSVGALAQSLGLSQSALSQHLARLREAGLLATTRERQSVRYRIADPRVLRLMETLYSLYCIGDS